MSRGHLPAWLPHRGVNSGWRGGVPAGLHRTRGLANREAPQPLCPRLPGAPGGLRTAKRRLSLRCHYFLKIVFREPGIYGKHNSSPTVLGREARCQFGSSWLMDSWAGERGGHSTPGRGSPQGHRRPCSSEGLWKGVTASLLRGSSAVMWKCDPTLCWNWGGLARPPATRGCSATTPRKQAPCGAKAARSERNWRDSVSLFHPGGATSGWPFTRETGPTVEMPRMGIRSESQACDLGWPLLDIWPWANHSHFLILIFSSINRINVIYIKQSYTETRQTFFFKASTFWILLSVLNASIEILWLHLHKFLKVLFSQCYRWGNRVQGDTAGNFDSRMCAFNHHVPLPANDSRAWHSGYETW